jgi:hypothetical protein
MELCSLEDAFPDIGASGPSKEERRAAKKKAKRCKGSIAPGADASSGDPDPDRPFVKKLGEVSAMMPYGEAFPDLSGVARDSVPAFRTTAGVAAATTESFKMPNLPGAACSFSDPGLPSYFGKDVEDEEGFADYSPNPTDLAGYMLGGPAPPAAATGAGSAVLPDVPATDAWKPLTPAGARSAYFQEFPPGSRPRTQSRTVERVEPDLIQVVSPREDIRKGGAGAPLKTSDTTDTTREQLLQRIQDLTKRLDELETRATRNSQQEILIFVGAGLGLLLTFDLAMRLRASR